MQTRRIVPTTEEHQRQSKAQCLPRGQLVHHRFRIRVDLEVVDPTQRGAQLILDPALETEHLDLEPVRRVCDLPRRPRHGTQRRQTAEQRDRNRGRRTGTASGRNAATDPDLHRQVIRWWADAEGRLHQRVARHTRWMRDERVRLTRGLDIEHVRRPPSLADQHLRTRSDGDVQHPPRPAEPRVGPAAVVTDPNRG